MNGLYKIQWKQILINFSIYYPRKHRLTYIANWWYNLKIRLRITIYSKLNFKEHINNIIKKAYYKLYALRRLRKFLA